MNVLRVKISYDQRRLIDKITEVYIFYIKKSFRKTNKNDWRSEKKQIKAINDHGEQLVEYNKLVKKDFNIGRDSIPLEEQKWYL